MMLEGIARSLKAGGFKTICLIADHAGSLKAQSEVAKRLTQEWATQGVRVLDVSDYYADAAETAFLKNLGETEDAIGQHAGIADTSELMSAHPEGRRSHPHSAVRRRADRRVGESRKVDARAGPVVAQHQGLRRDPSDQSAGGWDLTRSGAALSTRSRNGCTVCPMKPVGKLASSIP